MSIFEKNRGTKADPYEIWTEDDLRELIDYDDIGNPDLVIEFKSDIEMERDWTSPISPSNSYSDAFKGLIDGNGFTIRNLNSPNGSSLIYSIDQGTVKNLTLSSVKFNTDSSYRSPFLGRTMSPYSSSSRFANVINCGVEDAEINITDSDEGGVGAILGWAYRTSINISNTYVKNIEITRGLSGMRGSGTMVGYVQDRTVNLDNVFAFGEIRIYNATSGSDNWQSSLVGSLNRATVNGHVIQATTYSTHNSARRTDTPLVKDSYSSIATFGPEEAWDMVDGELPYLTYYGEKINPIKLSNISDLDLIRQNPNGNFGLSDDLHMSEVFTGDFIISETFTGSIDGNGFSISGIEVDVGDNGIMEYAFFRQIDGSVENIQLNYTNIVKNSGSANENHVATTMVRDLYGKLSRVSVSVDGQLNSRINSHGLFHRAYDNSKIVDCSLHIESMNSRLGNSHYIALVFGMLEGAPFIRNNIARVVSINGRRIGILFGSYDSLDVSNNIYLTENTNLSSSSGSVDAVSLESFRDGSNPIYDDFDRDIWLFQDSQDPIQHIFYVITEKIEERLISLYSKGISLKTRMSKGFKDIVKFFSKKSESDVKTRRAGNRLEINFSETISSKFSRAGKKLRDVKNYTGRALSNFIKSISVDKRVESYTEDILSKINSVKKSMKSNINKMNKINFNAYSIGLRKYFIGVMTYSKEIVTNSSWTKLIRVIKTAKSYTRGIRSLIWRFTNVYEFVVKWASSYSSPISSSVVKYSVIKRLSRTYTESISSYSRRLVKRGMSALKYARVNVRYNNVKMRLKESMTKIRAFKGGGD